MEKRKNIFCSWVYGNEEDLNRALLREKFSKFGNVKKIFIDADVTFAKVYFDDIELVKIASNQLDGFKSWKVKIHKDEYIAHDQGKNSNFVTPQNSSVSRSRTSLNNSAASYNEEMEEECMFAGNYVDAHGRPVEVLQAENGVMYINLDDVRSGGYNIYKKESFENAAISEDIDVGQLENYLLNQAMKFILSTKKKFDEEEMLGVFQRVKAKLQNKSGGEFGEGRTVHSSPDATNFTITKSTAPSISPGNRTTKELGENFQPTFSHIKARPKNNRFDEQNGSPTTSSVPRRPFEKKHDNRQDNRNDIRLDNKNDNRHTVNRNEDKRKSSGNNMGFTETESRHMRKPKTNSENPSPVKNVVSKAVAHSVASEEPTETWDGETTPVPKSKPQSDTASVTNERLPIGIERKVLAANSVQRIEVSYIKPDKKSLFYGHAVEDGNKIEEILMLVNTQDIKLPEISAPTRDMLCIAFFEECWYRGVVLHGTQPCGGAFVELIDYGNKEIIKSPLREMSEDMKKIPGLAIRFAVHMAPDLPLNVGQELEIFVKKHISDEFDDQTHLIEIKKALPQLVTSTPPSELSSDQEMPEKSKETDKPAAIVAEECFMEVPQSTLKLSNGEPAMIVSYTDANFILRNKDTAKNCKEVYSHLTSMEKKPIANPKVGQLVLCSRDGSEGMHRAVIKKINNQVAELEYLDYHGGETLTLKSLRNMDKILAAYPIAKLESPVVEWLNKVTEKSDGFLSDLVLNKTKLKVVLDGSKFDMLLPGDKEILLSEKIEQLENPPKEVPKVQTPVPKKTEEVPEAKPLPRKEEQPVVKTDNNDDKFIKISYDEMPFVPLRTGEEEYICFNCKNGSVTLIASSDATEYLDSITIDEPTDVEPYEPEPFEMCLGKLEDVWYRTIVTDPGSSGKTCEVLSVDFGNTETIPKTDIRRFPKNFAKIPILGIGAYFMGISEGPKVQERLKELIPDLSVLMVNVKTDLNDQLKCGIEIPSVFAQLKKENLI